VAAMIAVAVIVGLATLAALAEMPNNFFRKT
jgi:hypothetical protein